MICTPRPFANGDDLFALVNVGIDFFFPIILPNDSMFCGLVT